MGLGNWLSNQERILGEVLTIPCWEPSSLSCNRKLKQEPPFLRALISAGVKEGIWSQLALRLFLTHNSLCSQGSGEKQGDLDLGPFVLVLSHLFCLSPLFSALVSWDKMQSVCIKLWSLKILFILACFKAIQLSGSSILGFLSRSNEVMNM